MSQLTSPHREEETGESHRSESKRSRHENRSFSLSKRSDRHQRMRRASRLSSRDSAPQQSKETNLEGLIFDNGGHTIKINYTYESEPKLIPNCIMKAKSERKRLFIGSQIDECRDCSGLFYLIPGERGYITKWDVQKPIWDFVFSKNMFPVKEYPVVITQPLFNFKSIQDCIDEIFFEEYEVNSLFRTNPSDLVLAKYHQEIASTPPCIVVDSGYSFTHVVPYLEGKKYLKGIKRINVGGKLLTNHLKDIISYRQYHVMEETFVINQVKEDTCYVSSNFKEDLKMAELPSSKNNIVKNYVLPDFNNIRRGYVHDAGKKDELAENCQILRLNNERFTVPEILFNPSDIGIKSIGIADAIVKSIFLCPQYYQKDLAKNIVIVGGNTKFPGFQQRLFNEVRSLMPASWEVNVYHPTDPIGYSWMGGKTLLKKPNFKTKLVTKQQYDEIGLSAVQARFNDWSQPELHEDSKPKREVQPISYIEHIKKYDVFGKGTVPDEENSAEPSAKKGEDHNEATKSDEEIEVTKSVPEEKVEEKPQDKSDRPKFIRRTVKNSTGQVVYSVKIVSAASTSKTS